MKTKKPDRFERIVLTEMKKNASPSSTCIWLNGPDVAKLLRKEHQWMVRMVNKEFSKMQTITRDRTNSNGRIMMAHYKALQCRDILMLLKKRAT